MASLSPSQRAIVRRIVQIGREVKASPMLIKSALETGRVESNFTNSPVQSDHDSEGWRQERASLYKDPTNLDASIRRFYKEAMAVKAQYSRAGDLAAAVQRPAAQYRGRYQGVSGEADALLHQYGVLGGGGSPPPAATSGRTAQSPKVTTTTQTTPGTDNRALRAAAIQTFLGRSHQDPLQFALNIRNLQDVPPVSSSTRAAAPPAAPGASSSGPAVPGAAGAAVDFARSRIGAYSESAGSNRGPQLDKLEARFGFPGSGRPWCAMFTSVVVTRGGAPKVARTASVDEIRRQVNAGGAGYQHGFVQEARPGDLILFGNEHVAFVEGVGPGGEIHAISGNGRTGKVARVTYAAGSGDIARPLYTRPLK